MIGTKEMQIVPLQDLTNIKEKDDTGRGISCMRLDNVVLTGRSAYYPNVLLRSQNKKVLISPYDEKIMSLGKSCFYEDGIFIDSRKKHVRYTLHDPVFFFIYNFENYYHFVYDTLPYLWTYFYLIKTNPNLRLLVYYPAGKKDFYGFNLDILERLVDRSRWIIHDERHLYHEIYVSTSLTHGGFSNNPPRQEIRQVFQKLLLTGENNPTKPFPEKIYISRRTWTRPPSSNIGTDYTTRRKMTNEDEVVEKLVSLGFVEVFTEDLSMEEKIGLFSHAKVVVGAIGGGMVNLLFSPPTTKSIVIVSPYFLEINQRFRYCMEHTEIQYVYNVEHAPYHIIPLYTRVKIIDHQSTHHGIVGEICGYDKDQDKFQVLLSANDVAGFCQNSSYIQELFYQHQMEILDKGLNSPFSVCLDSLIQHVEHTIRLE